MKVIACAFLLLILISSFQVEDKSYLLGRFNPATDLRFSKLDDKFTSGSARSGYLRTEAYEAFKKMHAAAALEGVHLTIISATRNFDSQKGIWENKWNGRTLVEGKNLTTITDPAERARIILHYSSMPGSSRHHWGTDMDLNSLQNSYFDSGDGLKLYAWLTQHGSEFGFCQPYTSKSAGRTGYEEERWHWSYLPLSAEFLKKYKETIQPSDITGFDGCQVAVRVRIVDDYVDGVACK